MARKRDWMRHLADAAELQGEPLPGVPLVELAGEGRVLIECHMGVTQYSPERISVKVRFGCVCVCGCGLELSVMTREKIVISGRIDAIQLVRKKG